MEDSRLRISKVTLKNGNTIQSLPKSNANFKRFDFGWGEIVFRAYDNKDLKISDIYYMCDMAKQAASDSVSSE